jgi:hypothetical protein
LILEIKKETYKKLYLEFCSVWIRNIDPRKKIIEGRKKHLKRGAREGCSKYVK